MTHLAEHILQNNIIAGGFQKIVVYGAGKNVCTEIYLQKSIKQV
jgi:hypothetical protein